MGKRIAVIQGHPDPQGNRFGHALAVAYREGAAQGGHECRIIDVARLEFPLLRTQDDWSDGNPPPGIRDAQQVIAWADHLVILYPLWLGSMPALLKGFLEQTMRPGFALAKSGPGMMDKKLLSGRSARIVVTMGMPALFLGHGNPMNALEDNDWTRAWAALGATLPRPKAVLGV